MASNFAFGTLSIEVGNRLTIAGNKDSSGTNALYVGWLDIQGANTNTATSTFDTTTNALFLALNLPNVNLYYDKYDYRNDWLTDRRCRIPEKMQPFEQKDSLAADDRL